MYLGPGAWGLSVGPRVPDQGLEPPLDPRRMCCVLMCHGWTSPCGLQQSLELFSLGVEVGRSYVLVSMSVCVCACMSVNERVGGRKGRKECVCLGRNSTLS